MGCNCGGHSDGLCITGLSHIGIYVRDIEKSLEFYSMLGFDFYYKASVPTENGTLELAFLRCGTCVIELIQRPVYEERNDGTVDHIALEAENIDVIMERLIKNGIAFETDKPISLPMLFDNGAKCAFFRGPDGERLEFFEVL